MITFCIYFCVKLGLLQLYPTYVSYKAIKVNDEKEFHSLLIFWVVSITYLSLEYFADIFLFWLPFYTELKLIIVLWLILPQTQGTSVVYSSYLDPFLQQHQMYIDKTILDVQEKLKETIVLYGKDLIEFIKKTISDLIFKDSEEKTVDQSQIEPQSSTEGSYLISPYHLFSSLVAATANRIQHNNIDNTNEPTAPAELSRTDSHESLQSYVDINKPTATQATWGEYLSSWVVKRPAAVVVTEDKKDN